MPTPKTPAGFITRAEAARLAGVGTRTISRHVDEGMLPAYRRGPYLYFNADEVVTHFTPVRDAERSVAS